MIANFYRYISLPFVKLHILGMYKMFGAPHVFVGVCISVFIEGCGILLEIQNLLSFSFIFFLSSIASLVVGSSVVGDIFKKADEEPQLFAENSIRTNALVMFVVLVSFCLFYIVAIVVKS